MINIKALTMEQTAVVKLINSKAIFRQIFIFSVTYFDNKVYLYQINKGERPWQKSFLFRTPYRSCLFSAYRRLIWQKVFPVLFFP